MTGDDLYQFRLFWRAMAEAGMCDAPGGAEYRRVLAEWKDAGCPRPIFPFIRARANLGLEPPTLVE